MQARRSLGQTGILVSPIGMGTNQFGSKSFDQNVANAAIGAALVGGVNWFDTAEIYGRGQSERTLAAGLAANGRSPGDVVIATKWLPILRTASSIMSTFPARRQALSPFGIDLHQIHFPLSLSSLERQIDAMAGLLQNRAIRAVGVSNFSAQGMRKAHALLAKRSIPLAANQVNYSLLARGAEKKGIMAAAKELGVTVIAYFPLARGLLTGKYHAGATGRRGQVGARALQETLPLITALKEIGEKHGVAPGQVALNWTTNFHGETVVAIPGAKSAAQAQSNAAAMTFALSPEDYARIDAAAPA